MTRPSWLGRALIAAAWSWVLLVAALTFWGMWEIPGRLPEINEIATTHLLLFPVSLGLFFSLSWIRQRHDHAESNAGQKSFIRWRATLGLWLLLFLHPISCGLYPALFNLDDRTVEQITRAVEAMGTGLPRAEVETRIMALNATLPVSMRTDREQHRVLQAEVAQYLRERDPAVRRSLWPAISRATLVFVPRGPTPEIEPIGDAHEQVFQRRVRTPSDIGVDTIRFRYGPSLTVEEIVYSSNRQLTMARGPCTVHIVVPAPPEAGFPYPCPK